MFNKDCTFPVKMMSKKMYDMVEKVQMCIYDEDGKKGGKYWDEITSITSKITSTGTDCAMMGRKRQSSLKEPTEKNQQAKKQMTDKVSVLVNVYGRS